jgi:hypothetical protein
MNWNETKKRQIWDRKPRWRGYYWFRDKLTPNWFFQAANPVAVQRKLGGRSCFPGVP